jgi:uncharacterized protein YdhG (YjbR/CyaY superfamily)
MDGASKPQRSTPRARRSTLHELLPDATEELSYGVPAFVVNGNLVAGYGWARRHGSCHPHSSATLAELID